MINAVSVCCYSSSLEPLEGLLPLHIINTDRWQTNCAKKLHMTGAPVLRENNTLLRRVLFTPPPFTNMLFIKNKSKTF